MADLTASIAVGVIKTVAVVYDVVTLPVYALVQRPWTKTSGTYKKKAIPHKKGDNYSYWSKIGDFPDHHSLHAKSLADLFSSTCSVYGDKKAFGFRETLDIVEETQPDGKVFKKSVLGDYKWFTYKQMDERVTNLARGFMRQGIKPGDLVLILSETRLEWYLSAQAIFRLGGTIATLYATLGDDGIIHGINETAVTHMVTSYDLVPKLVSFQDRIPRVKTVIYMEGLKSPDVSQFTKIKTVPFKTVEHEGKTQSPPHGKFVPPKMDDPAIVMYTSGSTGIPKGVVITHRNVLCTIGGFFAIAHTLANKSTYMAYLPLAHVLELAAESFFSAIGTTIGYSTPHTMTDKATAIKKGCHGDAHHLQPTVIAAVPLVLDRIRKGVVDTMESRGVFFKHLFQYAMEYKRFWVRRGFQTPIVNHVICNKVRALMGSKIEQIVCGSAPLSPDTMEFIRDCLNVTVIQGYGLTETAAGATLMTLDDLSVGRVGPPLKGVNIKLADWTEGYYSVHDKPHPRGEIIIGGDCVATGYYKNEQLTAESFFEQDGIRWFNTGDIGEIHDDGSIKIVDRKKDLVKLQFGEYVSLGKVETELKSCPVVDNVCVYGDSGHNYVVAIVAPNPKAVLSLAKAQGKEGIAVEQLYKDSQIIDAVTKMIREHGLKAKLLKMEIPTKILIVSDEWSPDSGMVTAAMKIRRKNIEEHYKSDIKRMYNDSKSS